MILSFKDFINEKLSQDDVLDLYNYFSRILSIHEKHFYQDDKISKNANFKSDINGIFHKMMMGKKPFTEELYNKVAEYERNLYNDSKITPDDNFGCSMWDVCDIILEDPETLNDNSYIQDFSEEDIYVEIDNPYDSNQISGLVSNLDRKIETNSENKCEELVSQAFDLAKDKYDDEIEIIDYAIEIISSYIEEYPDLSDELRDEIESLEEWKKNRF